MEVKIDRDNYQQVVVESPVPTVVDFWGPQCVRCLELMPVMEALAEANKTGMRLIKIDAGQNRRLCLSLRLLSLPAFLFYRGGQEVGRLSGNHVSETELREAVARFLNPIASNAGAPEPPQAGGDSA